MRELFVVDNESTETSLVLRTEDGEEFFLDLGALAPDIRAQLAGAPSPAPEPEAPAEAAQQPEQATPEAPAASEAPAAPAPAPRLTAVGSAPRRPTTEKLSMRPPEIQHRIRAGATVAELAEEMGVAESRVEPFAHPVLMERSRVAELAKQAHPVREDGPAKLTIYEVLATAFAARGHSLTDATWDAYREKGQPWTVRVTWKTGLSENEAEWTLRESSGSASTLVARNTVAADLTDPDFVQPVRSLTSVGRGSRRVEALDAREDEDFDPYSYGEQDDLDALRHSRRADASEEDDTVVEVTDVTDLTAPTVTPVGTPHDTSNDSEDAEPAEVKADAASKSDDKDEEFLQNPSPAPKPSKRRRRASTPNWEDVLLGVRGNTKRPRD
ncbi:septation protein SepH [Corynebacterium phoceense]